MTTAVDGNIEIPWMGVMVPYTDFLSGNTRYAPGWECTKCGMQYGSVSLPNKCWNGCESDAADGSV